MASNLSAALAILRFRARWARGLLIAQSALPLALIALSAAQFAVRPSFDEITVSAGSKPSILPAILAVGTSIASLLWLALAVIAPIVVLMWVYRAHANLRLHRLDGLNYSPGWAVGSFFVPLINLVVPLRAMRELCNRSFGESEYQAHEPVGDVSSWWTCFVVGGLLLSYLASTALIEATTPFRFTTPLIAVALLSIFASLLMAGAAFFLFRIIGKVTDAQNSVTGMEATFA